MACRSHRPEIKQQSITFIPVMYDSLYFQTHLLNKKLNKPNIETVV